MSAMEMNLLDFVREKYDYMFWSERELMAAIRTVPDEGVYREQNISAGSIYKLTAHMLGAQTLWLARWEGDSAATFPQAEAYPTIEAALKQWEDVHRRLAAFLAKQSVDSMQNRVSFKRQDQAYASELWKVMLHVADHSTYHRGQMNSMIKFGGGKPTDAAYFLYRKRYLQDA